MTNKVNELNALMAGTVNNVGMHSKVRGANKDDSSGFSGAFEIAKGSADSRQNIVNAGKSADQNNVKDARDCMSSKGSKEIEKQDTNKKDPVNNDKDKAEFTQDTAKSCVKIKKSIKDTMGVSDEELDEAMQTLGLTATDLLNPQNVKELCMELNGVEDSISLLTNSELYDSVKELCNMAVQESDMLAGKYGISAEELSGLIDDEGMLEDILKAADELMENADSLSGDDALSLDVFGASAFEGVNDDAQAADYDFDAATAETATNAAAAEGDLTVYSEDILSDAAEVLEGENPENDYGIKVTVTGNKNEPIKNEEVRVNDIAAENVKTEEKTAAGSVTETFKSASKSEESSLRGRNEGFEGVSRFAESDAQSTGSAVQMADTTVTQTNVNSVGEIVETVAHYSNVDGSQILSQVTESIRVNYTPETTALEMQLHPESLGNVNMHISSTNGVVTAQILVENEAVKTALENQLITLQETFEEQGHKVESVEVAVANYNLGQRMDSQTGNDSERDRARGFGRIGGRRRINLNDLNGSDEDEMSEEEMIAADMMARNGNSIDFMA